MPKQKEPVRKGEFEEEVFGAVNMFNHCPCPDCEREARKKAKEISALALRTALGAVGSALTASDTPYDVMEEIRTTLKQAFTSRKDKNEN